MLFKKIFTEVFILDIMKISGNSDDVCLKTIEHYKQQLENPNLPDIAKNMAQAFVNNLSNYYEMSNLESPKLRQVLPHLSESARFIESKRSDDMEIESSGRIKSFYSFYQKLIDKMFDCIANDKPTTSQTLLFDIYATRDIFSPRHDMRFNPEAFYKHTYKTIFEYMEFIDNLCKTNSQYSFVEQSEKTLRDLERPKIITYDSEKVHIPQKDFIGYILESKNIPNAFRYLSSLPDNLSASTIKDFIIELKKCDLDNENLSKLGIYSYIEYQTQIESRYAVRNHFENILLEKLKTIKKEDILQDYSSLTTEDFIEKYKFNLSKYDIDCCNFVNYMSKYINSDTFAYTDVIYKLQNNNFSKNLSNHIDYFRKMQLQSIKRKLEEIKNIDLESFENNLSESQKIEHYSRCFKDYMKNPKRNGYQSLHILVRTPFGTYEKQIRTEAQHTYSENGPASHSTEYKPSVIDTFHRLKIPKIFSPKRDSNGEIIKPIELGILPFEQCVHSLYKKPFSYFSKGKTFEELQAEFPEKEDFDEAILALSPISSENNFLKKIKQTILKTINPNISDTQKVPTSDSTDKVPTDIAVYPNNNSTPQTNGSFSTDDSDPHDNR